MLVPEHIRDSLSSNIVNLDGITLASSTSIRNLDVIFDQELSFNSHIKQISTTAFFQLCNIVKIWHIKSQQDAEKIVHLSVTSRPDYCNSLFSGCPKKILKILQLIQKCNGRQTHTLILRIGSQHCFLIKLIVRSGLSSPYLCCYK